MFVCVCVYLVPGAAHCVALILRALGTALLPCSQLRRGVTGAQEEANFNMLVLLRMAAAATETVTD